MVNPKKLEKGPLMKIQTPEGMRFCQWYLYVTDMPTDVMELQKDEVAQVRWLSREVVEQMLEKEPSLLTRSAPQWLPKLLTETEVPAA